MRQGGKRKIEPPSPPEQHPPDEFASLPHGLPQGEQQAPDAPAPVPHRPPEDEQHLPDELAPVSVDPPEGEPPEGEQQAPDALAPVPHGPPEGEQHLPDDLAPVPHGLPEDEQHLPHELAPVPVDQGEQHQPDELAPVPVDPPEGQQHPPHEHHGPGERRVPIQPSGVKRPKVYSTPAEALAGMMPPGAKIVLNHNDHRFRTTWTGPTAGIPAELTGKHFTRNFGANRSWQDALCECHQRLWEKWGYISTSLPLPEGKQPQEPGVVPDDVLAAIGHHIDKLPKKKDYTTKR